MRELRARAAEPHPEPVRGVRELPLPLPLHGRGRARGASTALRPRGRRVRLGHGLGGDHRGGGGDQARASRRRRTVAVEPVQCPTLYDVGFGAHRIEGIGDKHVTWIHNVLRDRPARVRRRPGLPARACSSCRRARTRWSRRASPRETGASSWRDVFGVSGICNVLAAIKAARHYGLGPRQALVTVATDGFDRYPSVLRRLDAEVGPMTRDEARRRLSVFRGPEDGLGARGHARRAPALAQPEVLHVGRAAGQDRGRAARAGGPGVLGRAPGARATRSTARCWRAALPSRR